MKEPWLLEVNKFVVHSRVFALAAALYLLGLPVQTVRAATLTHRYSFDADAGDSVGGANGVLQGNAFVTNEALVLDGTNSSVQLPNNLFTNYTSISFEVWFANGALTSPNARLYFFKGASGTITYSLFGQAAYFLGASSNVVTLPVPAVAGMVHLIWTQDSGSQTACLYVNGLLAGENTNFTFAPALINSTTNDCIGGIGSASTVSNYNGRILEFRTYQGALTPLEAAVADAFGPDRAQLNPGTLENVRVIAPPSTGPGALFRLGAFADFANVTNVNISTQPNLVLSSDNTNVIVIAPDQRLQTVGFGLADIIASYQGLSNTLAVTVGVPEDIALIHRYGFNEQTNDWIVHDSVGDADGQLLNAKSFLTVNAAFTGNGELILKGANGSPLGASSGYVALPPAIVSSLSEVSIEAWVTWTLNTSFGWQRIFDFGNSSGGNFANGITYLFLSPDGGNWTTGLLDLHFAASTNATAAESPWLDWTNILSLNVTSVVVVTYSPARGTAKMYLNGQSVSSGVASIPLSAIIDTNNWLGRSQWGQDSYFGGRYDEFRIYRGLLSDADVAVDYAAGPEVVGVDYLLHYYASSNSLAITWGTTATNWFLESCPVLGPDAVWTTVTNAPTLENGRYRVTVPLSGDASYFRLHAPP